MAEHHPLLQELFHGSGGAGITQAPGHVRLLGGVSIQGIPQTRLVRYAIHFGVRSLRRFDMESFMTYFEANLRASFKQNPEQFGYKEEDFPRVLQNWRDRLARGNEFHKDGPAMKATCKALGIPCTYKAIRKFIATHR